MKKVYLFILSIFISSIVFISCTRDNDSEFEGIDESFAQIDVRFEYARLLSLAVQEDSNLNQTLENLAKKSLQEGYYEQEFFVALDGFQGIPELENQSLHSVLLNMGNKESQDVLNNFSSTHPGMSVLLVGDENTSTYSNRVYVDDNFDDSNPATQINYFINGELFSHAISELPEKKAFIVRDSEAYVSVEELENPIYDSPGMKPVSIGKSIDGNDIMVQSFSFGEDLLDPFDDGSGGGGSGGGDSSGTCTETCERDCPDNQNKTENLYRFRTRKDYDAGFRGKGEWFFVIVFADDVQYSLDDGEVNVTGNPLGFVRTGEVGRVRDNFEWRVVNFSSIIWDRATDGDRMKIVAFEADGGKAKTIDIPLSFMFNPFGILPTPIPLSSNISISIGDGDDFIGEILIEYCQDLDFQYFPAGDVEIQLNQR